MARFTEDVLFRYQVISQILTRMSSGSTRAQAVRCTAAITHLARDGSKRKLSKRTLYRWLLAYEGEQLSSLEKAMRTPLEGSRVLSQGFVDYLVQQKGDDARASIPEIIQRARNSGVLKDTDTVDRTTVYRVARRLALCVKRVKKKRHDERDTRRFAYPHRLDMVLCDGKHFRAGIQRAKRVALHFLDDSSRFFLHAVVGTSESAALFLCGLYEMICKHGLFDATYLDKGPGFFANNSASVIANLPALLIYGETAYPAGHGKIERFNQTALNDLLRGWDGRADIDPECRALQLRLIHYGEEVYNHRPHASLSKQTPWERFHADHKPLRFPESDETLRRKFELHFERRVSNDHVVSMDSIFYEMPRGYAGQRVVVRQGLLDQTVHFLHQGHLIQIHPVDLEKNARLRRARPRSNSEDVEHSPQRSAADMAYENDFRPIVDSDGGFQDDTHKEEEL